MAHQTYYEILGVAESATQGDIERAFRILVLEIDRPFRERARADHPDVGGDAEEFRRLADERDSRKRPLIEAHEALSDLNRRREYDAQLATARNGAPSEPSEGATTDPDEGASAEPPGPQAESPSPSSSSPRRHRLPFGLPRPSDLHLPFRPRVALYMLLLGLAAFDRSPRLVWIPIAVGTGVVLAVLASRRKVDHPFAATYVVIVLVFWLNQGGAGLAVIGLFSLVIGGGFNAWRRRHGQKHPQPGRSTQ